MYFTEQAEDIRVFLYRDCESDGRRRAVLALHARIPCRVAPLFQVFIQKLFTYKSRVPYGTPRPANRPACLPHSYNNNKLRHYESSK
jgi:hypothetical protein